MLALPRRWRQPAGARATAGSRACAGPGFGYSRAMHRPTASLVIALQTLFPAAIAGVNNLGNNNPHAPLWVDD